MPAIEVSNLIKDFGSFRAIDDVSFSVEEGEVLVIVGASGCGKTTTLRSIAGLDMPTAGTIVIDGQTVFSSNVFVPPEQRGVGMVFQSYALWPHKTVFENVAYSLQIKRLPKARIREKVEQALALVDLPAMGDRYPSAMSGGQQQRVALARSVVAEPRVLLLDEPLSNLDAKLREQMRDDLKRLVKQLRITAVHITHDQTEAMGIADRLICMRKGRIEQVGSAQDLYRRPANRYVADFIGMATFVDGEITRHDESGRALVRLREGIELWTGVPAGKTTSHRANVTLALRPETLIMARNKRGIENEMEGTVLEATFLGDHTEYLLGLGGLKLRARSMEDFAIGSQLYANLPADRVICLSETKTTG